MLFSGVSGLPRRLALLAVAIFIVAIIFLQSSDYRTEYLPPTPGFSLHGNDWVNEGGQGGAWKGWKPKDGTADQTEEEEPEPSIDPSYGYGYRIDDSDVVSNPPGPAADKPADVAEKVTTAERLPWEDPTPPVPAPPAPTNPNAPPTVPDTQSPKIPPTIPDAQAPGQKEGPQTPQQDAPPFPKPGEANGVAQDVPNVPPQEPPIPRPDSPNATPEDPTKMPQPELPMPPTEPKPPTPPANPELLSPAGGPSDAASSKSKFSYTEIQSKIQQLIRAWTPPPIKNHWPPYEWYREDDYDPNAWESFDWDNDYFINNGVSRMMENGLQPEPYSPYPKYQSEEYKAKWKGGFHPCVGPRDKLLNESDDDLLKAYSRRPEGFPANAIGDAAITNINLDRCLDRDQRLGPYGFGQEKGQLPAGVGKLNTPVDWRNVRWGELQNHCLDVNKERFAPDSRQLPRVMFEKNLPERADDLPVQDPIIEGPSYHHRTALLIRSWEGYEYTENDLQTMRALVSELSLQSGGEYQVFLYINIKNTAANIYTDKQIYDDLVKANAPPEFQSITVLWNEQVFPEWYARVEDWQVYWHQFMCLQWFSKTHPEFDYIWNWEVDARYTANHYELLEGVTKFAKEAPRKFLWERNARYYIPSAHGTYDEWFNETSETIRQGIREGTVKPVWGPKPWSESQVPVGPTPPRTMLEDDFEWGVGEEADLVTLLPIWDPVKTEWTMKDKIWNFVPGIRPHFSKEDPIDESFTHPKFAEIPRRAYINTLSRFSKRLVHAMHMENRAGRTMQAELWPATVALHHGLKAVYAPHPIWQNRQWPAWYMDAVINANDNDTAAWGARKDSIYNHDREHNSAGWSWSYHSEFPEVLYRRWLGWRTPVGPELQFPNNPLRVLGGPEYEDTGIKTTIPAKQPDGSQAAPPGGSSFGGVEITAGGHGKMCLPPMLMHPVKNIVSETDLDE